jgi:hypothetical protein
MSATWSTTTHRYVRRYQRNGKHTSSCHQFWFKVWVLEPLTTWCAMFRCQDAGLYPLRRAANRSYDRTTRSRCMEQYISYGPCCARPLASEALPVSACLPYIREQLAKIPTSIKDLRLDAALLALFKPSLSSSADLHQMVCCPIEQKWGQRHHFWTRIK